MKYKAIHNQPLTQTVQHQNGAFILEHQALSSNVLGTKDLVIGTVIALVMETLFTLLSSGMSLIVTFVPGIILAG